MERNDVIIVGSGINSLVAGALLSRAGWKVLICERNESAGGAIATSTTATLPGFTHELLSSCIHYLSEVRHMPSSKMI